MLGAIEPALYLTAAMTGLRQGELIALRWKDVDWKAGVVRVRKNFTRGRFGTPKSRRSQRAVPMPRRVSAALKALWRRSNYTADDDLVFGHPETGKPFDTSKMRKRFNAAISDAGVARLGFTTCATPSAPVWLRLAHRCEPCRSGWGTETSTPL